LDFTMILTGRQKSRTSVTKSFCGLVYYAEEILKFL